MLSGANAYGDYAGRQNVRWDLSSTISHYLHFKIVQFQNLSILWSIFIWISLVSTKMKIAFLSKYMATMAHILTDMDMILEMGTYI